MKHPGYAIREAVTTALMPLVDAGYSVGIFDEATTPNAGFPRIVMLGLNGGGPRLSKCGFGGSWSQLIKVTDSTTGGLSKNKAEQLASMVMEILVPQLGPFIDLSPDFNVWKVEATAAGVTSYADAQRKYIDININVNYFLTEN